MYKKIFKIIVPEDIKEMALSYSESELNIVKNSRNAFTFEYKKYIKTMDDLIKFVKESYMAIINNSGQYKNHERIIIPINYCTSEVAIFLPENKKIIKNSIFIGSMKNSFCETCNREIYNKLFIR